MGKHFDVAVTWRGDDQPAVQTVVKTKASTSIIALKVARRIIRDKMPKVVIESAEVVYPEARVPDEGTEEENLVREHGFVKERYYYRRGGIAYTQGQARILADQAKKQEEKRQSQRFKPANSSDVAQTKKPELGLSAHKIALIKAGLNPSGETIAVNREDTVASGYICAVILPLIGLIIGAVLLSKDDARGIPVMIVSVVASIIWAIVFALVALVVM
jgi:hypothetical protein